MKTILRSLMIVSALALPAFAAKTKPATAPAAAKTEKPATKSTKTAHHKKSAKGAADAPKTDQPPADAGK